MRVQLQYSCNKILKFITTQGFVELTCDPQAFSKALTLRGHQINCLQVIAQSCTLGLEALL